MKRGARPQFAARNADIALHVAAGHLTLEEIGQSYGLTRERVRQIAKREGTTRQHVAVPMRPRLGKRIKCPACGVPIRVGRKAQHNRDANHPLKPDSLRPSDHQLIQVAYEGGLGYHAIADVFGIEPMAVKYHVVKAGLTPHPTGRRLAYSEVARLKADLAARRAA